MRRNWSDSSAYAVLLESALQANEMGTGKPRVKKERNRGESTVRVCDERNSFELHVFAKTCRA